MKNGAGRTALACVLAWVLPGAGHLYLGKRVKAVIFFAVVTVTFLLGLAMDGRVYLAASDQPLSYLATAANMGLGPLDLLGRKASYDRIIYTFPSELDRAFHAEILEKTRRRILAATHEYGTTFILTASLMNLLLILDAYDIGIGRKP
jgi:TM2 domain-containing membrane protein YozV